MASAEMMNEVLDDWQVYASNFFGGNFDPHRLVFLPKTELHRYFYQHGKKGEIAVLGEERTRQLLQQGNGVSLYRLELSIDEKNNINKAQIKNQEGRIVVESFVCQGLADHDELLKSAGKLLSEAGCPVGIIYVS